MRSKQSPFISLSNKGKIGNNHISCFTSSSLPVTGPPSCHFVKTNTALRNNPHANHIRGLFVWPHSLYFNFLQKLFIYINFYLFIYLFIYLILAVLGLCCCAQAFSSCSEQGLLFIAVHGLLTVVASLFAELWLQAHGLSSYGLQAPERRLNSCGAWAQLLHGMWGLPKPVLEPVSPALAGGFPATAPPGKPFLFILYYFPWLITGY